MALLDVDASRRGLVVISSPLMADVADVAVLSSLLCDGSRCSRVVISSLLMVPM